jgi:hypothetical protein
MKTEPKNKTATILPYIAEAIEREFKEICALQGFNYAVNLFFANRARHWGPI